MKNKGLMVLMSLMLLVSSFTVNAEEKAETVNDLFKLYNEAELEDSNEAKQAYLNAVEIYNNEQSFIENQEIFNEIIEDAELWRESELQKIDDEVSELLISNSDLLSRIEYDIDLDWKLLDMYDREYKSNVEHIISLLSQKDKYTVAAKQIIDYGTLDELGKEIEELQTTYEASTNVGILGDVSNVKYPLGKPTVVTSPYGNRVDPITGKSITFHSGMDLRAAIGTPVLSLFNGTVIDTGYGAAGGYYVNIDHGNGVRTYYCHLSEIKVEKGQKLKQYDVIALSGNTGSRTTGPHLHFGVYINGNSVDPGVLFKES